MRKINTLFSSILILTLALTTSVARAQAPVGPSDATTLPPANATAVGKVLCAGTAISISGPTDAGGLDFTAYQWSKQDAAGVWQVVTGQTGRTYTETPTTAGYYNYEVVTVNASGCTSPVSDPFKIFVLPPISTTITAAMSTICSGVGTTLLTANPTPATGYTLNYQWTRNGVNITGANGATYAVSNETTTTTATTITFGVNVSYTLNSACTASATQDIIIAPIPTKPSITAN